MGIGIICLFVCALVFYDFMSQGRVETPVSINGPPNPHEAIKPSISPPIQAVASAASNSVIAAASTKDLASEINDLLKNNTPEAALEAFLKMEECDIM